MVEVHMQDVPKFEEAVWSNCGELFPGVTIPMLR
jgi:hypothetical protein